VRIYGCCIVVCRDGAGCPELLTRAPGLLTDITSPFPHATQPSLAQLLFGFNCNILSSDQFTDETTQTPRFFQRIEFDFSGISVGPGNLAVLERAIDDLASRYAMKYQIGAGGGYPLCAAAVAAAAAAETGGGGDARFRGWFCGRAAFVSSSPSTRAPNTLNPRPQPTPSTETLTPTNSVQDQAQAHGHPGVKAGPLPVGPAHPPPLWGATVRHTR